VAQDAELDPLDRRGPDGVSERWKQTFIPPEVRQLCRDLLNARRWGRCNDGLTGERAVSRIAHDTCVKFGATLDGWHARVRLFWPHLCQCRAADPGCIYAICNQRGVCIYPVADGSRCSLIMRGEP
jgi:hypothetical protein